MQVLQFYLASVPLMLNCELVRLQIYDDYFNAWEMIARYYNIGLQFSSHFEKISREQNSTLGCYCCANLALPCLMPLLRLYETQKPHPKICKLQSFINFPALLCFKILQMLETSSVHIFIGSLNVGSPTFQKRGCYAGRSDCKGNFLKSFLTFVNSKFIGDVLPVLPGAPNKYFPFIAINL